jgi:methionyl-tRNA formyltransferase
LHHAAESSGLRLVFVGNGAAAGRALVAAARFADVIAVATDDAAVSRVAADRAPVLPARIVKDDSFAEYLRQHSVDLLLNVYSLDVATASVVAAPMIGSFNLHPGLLPEFAGLNVSSWAIFEGSAEHGVTLHWMDAGIDTGPIAYREAFDVAPDETGLSLSVKAIERGLALVSRLLADAVRDAASIPRVEQDAGRRRYFGAGPPRDGAIDWRAPAAAVVAFVRAADYHPFPSPWGTPATFCGGRPVGVVKACTTGRTTAAAPGTIGMVTGNAVEVAAGDEWVMIERVRVDGAIVDAVRGLPLAGRCEAA